MMENWLALGLAAALSYSISGLATKVALDKKYMGLEPTSVALLVMAGVVLGFASFYLIFAGLKVPEIKPAAALVGLAVGFFWALDSLMVYFGLIRGAEVSRMAPIYNLNTLLVVAGGIILLHELPDKNQAIRVAAGAILIVIGGVLVSA